MKIAIDLGHGLNVDTGLVGLIDEEELIDSVGNILIESLKKEGNIVVPVRPKGLISTIGQSMGARVKLSNDYKVDLFISLHGCIRKQGGAEAYTYRKVYNVIACRILSNLEKLGFNNQGIKDGKNLYVIKNTICPAILLQICSINSVDDYNIYKATGPEKIANAIAEGILGRSIEQNEPKTDILLNIKNILSVSENADNNELITKLPLIKYGDQGYLISLIQQILHVDCDGIFGNITRNAVVNFQKNNNLHIDGIIGIDTWKALINI